MNAPTDPELALRALCQAQTQLMVAENGAMLARMAASLTHELNTPLGALSGAFQTLRSVVDRLSRGESIDAGRTADLDRRLDEAFRDAVDRIHDVIRRMQRIANLYGAETCTVRLDDLIGDVVALLDPKFRFAHAITLDLQTGLTAECHPEQIAAVVSALLHHLLQMAHPSGISVRLSGDRQRVTIDILVPELVLSEKEIACMFHPGLQASHCTWNVYSARQILLAHQGDLRISSTQEAGTMVTLTLRSDRSQT